MRPGLHTELAEFVRTSIMVNGKIGDGQVCSTLRDNLPADAPPLGDSSSSRKRQRTTLQVNTDGWVVYAKARRELVPGDILADDTIGMLLVSASNRDNTQFLVHVLVTHHQWLRCGVGHRMWMRLEEQLRARQRTGPFDLIVSGGPCLNSPEAAEFYRKHGFVVPKAGRSGDTISGWTKHYAQKPAGT